MHDKAMEIPIYNDSRDHIYAQLIRILFSSGNKPLSAKNEHDLWQLFHDVVTLSENEYKQFIESLQKMRQAVDSTEVFYRRFICDIITLSHLDYEKHLEEIEELRKHTISPFKKPYVNLICDLVCVPEDSYQHFLENINVLRDMEIHPVLNYFTPNLP